jgi:energy-coupling factor transport system ATP-binding protein
MPDDAVQASVPPSPDGADAAARDAEASHGARVTATGFGLTPAGAGEPVLQGVDLEVEPGQIVLLSGPSGAGKSTLLHALAGVLEADEEQGDDESEQGEAVHGIRTSGNLLVEGNAPRAGHSGLVQQDPETQVVMARIGDDVAFGAENLGAAPKAIWPRVREALAAVGLGELDLNHATNALSGGQKQRLAVAGLLAMGPKLWLLDEPTANLDPEGAEALRSVVVATAREAGATVIVVEHRLDLWLENADRLVVLAPPSPGEPAKVVADGAPTALLKQADVVRALVAAGVRVPGHAPSGRARPHRPRAGDVLLSARDLSVTRAALPRRADKRVRVRAAVEHVHLEVRSGEAVCLIGRNGQGKTALALTLAGLQRVRSGSLEARGSLADGVRHASPERFRPRELVARIGMVFQDPEHQFLTRRVRDELAFGPRRTGADVDEVQARVDELLARLHLEHVADLNPYQLSGGQQRRLSVGTALATRPGLLVLDEPTFGQDANTWGDLVTLLTEELERGTGILAVTHDADFVAALGARRILVEGGAACEQP